MDGTSETDESLAAKGQGGNMDALDALVRRHQSGVYNLALRMVWRRDVAEDATQPSKGSNSRAIDNYECENHYRISAQNFGRNDVLS